MRLGSLVRPRPVPLTASAMLAALVTCCDQLLLLPAPREVDGRAVPCPICGCLWNVTRLGVARSPREAVTNR